MHWAVCSLARRSTHFSSIARPEDHVKSGFFVLCIRRKTSLPLSRSVMLNVETSEMRSPV
jgi:hypothetical protein